MKLVTEIPFIYFFLLFIFSVTITWYFYIFKNKWSDVPNKVKYTIYGIRFLVLFFIGILLLGLFVEKTEIKEEKPILINIIDNSSSLLNYKDSLDVKKKIPEIISKIRKLNSKFEQRFYTIGEQFNHSKTNVFNETKSNLSLAFEQVFSTYYNRNIGAIVFISDGNFNEGQNPIYAASKIQFTPIFTIGVGDTIQKFDQILTNVICNEVAFLNNKFPIQINVENHKLKDKKSKINLFQNGKLINTKIIENQNNKQNFHEIIFEVGATKVGFQHFVAEIEEIESEYTFKNNKKSFYVEILDARNKILILSGAPHPDLSALKTAFENDKNIQVELKMIDKWDKNLKNTDLIIWHEPGIGFRDEINDLIKKTKTSVLYFIGINTSQNIIDKLNIGLETANSKQQDEVQGFFNSGFDLFEFSDEMKTEIQKYPPLIVKYGTPKLANQNQVFLKQKLTNIQKNDALAYFGSNDGIKYGVFLGEGIWRWKMANYIKSKNHALFTDFFTKINQFLVQKQNTSNLRITLPNRFVKSEDILIKAEFYNEAMELITKPIISYQLIDQKGKVSDLEFGANEQNYTLKLGRIKSGVYKWKASTTFNNKKYSKTGSFIVEDIQIEKLDTKANHTLLHQLALNSKGKFYTLNNVEKLYSDILNRNDITTISYQESRIESILDFVWILILIILMLGFEWFLKRWNGYY
jgi:hypothetical protein